MVMCSIVGLLILLGLFLWYKNYYQPKKLCQWYADNFTRLGYRVYKLPYEPYDTPIYNSFDQSKQEKDDPLYHLKFTYQGYDVLIGNIYSRPHIIFLNLKVGR